MSKRTILVSLALAAAVVVAVLVGAPTKEAQAEFQNWQGCCQVTASSCVDTDFLNCHALIGSRRMSEDFWRDGHCQHGNVCTR